MDPKQFWTDHGPKVMEQLMDALDGHRKNPQSVGKDPNVYRLLPAPSAPSGWMKN